MGLRLNWVGLAGGVTTIVMLIVSLFYPWWQLRIGEDLATANISPLNTNFNVLGTGFSIPLLWAVNLVSVLTLLASSVAMMIYSFVPAKLYSKTLLSFAYRKPLYILLAFVILLFASTVAVQALLHFNVPLTGSVYSKLPITLIQGTIVSVLISTEFQWPFWLAVVATGLCIAARIYHRKFAVAPKPDVSPVEVAPPAEKTAQ